MADEYDYWISFHISLDRSRDGRDYDARYQALVKAVGEVANVMSWDETTSFYLVRSTYGIDAVGRHLKAAIDETKDTVLMRLLGNPTARLAGIYRNGNLNKFMPYVKNA